MDLNTAYQHHLAGRYADAARGYQALLEREPDHANALHLFGVLHQQCGYPARAVELIERAVALRPDVAPYHANLAEAHRALGHAERAADCCRTALRLQPNYPEATNNLGLALHDLGRYEEAVAQFDAALALLPTSARTHNNRGSSLREQGKEAEALEAFREAVRLDPTLAPALANLGQILINLDQPAEGLVHCREAVRLQPNLPAAHNNLGNALRALQKWSEARDAYAEAIRLEPRLAVAHTNLALTLQFEGRVRESLPHFRRAVELAPEDLELYGPLADALALEDDWAAVILQREHLVRLDPDNPDAHNDLGWAYQAGAQAVQAEAAYRRALELQPDHLDAWLNLGSLHEELGALAEAEECYRRAETLNPTTPLPLARRAVLVRGRLPDADRDRIRYSLYRPDPGPFLRMSLLFALAQVADARGDHAEAAACLEPANALARQLRRGHGQFYDADEHSRYVDRIQAAFTPELFRRLGKAGDDTRQPVFVFGLPRSGTTLVEQVLASHSQVHGAGELNLVRRAMDSLPSGPDPDSTNLDALDDDALRLLTRGYSEAVEMLLAGKAQNPPERVVNKMPDNYLYLGLIALMFPQATLIHVRRDLRDTAVSCWLTHFRSIRWADAQDDLVRRFRDYRRVMEHWRAVLPVPIHEVCYEELVDDFETQARRLVAACGLPWEASCLDFHQTSRPVRTASVTQVRQPLYRKAVARWKAYQPDLASLFARLPEP
jgi:tetratricopeptide (TPR) repeat protein